MNFYELLVCDELERRGLAVFIPYKDRGVDCLVVRRDFTGRPQRVQIKGSRTYPRHESSWYQIGKTKLNAAKTTTDFWIFVSQKTSSRGVLRPMFVIVPSSDLYDRLTAYAAISAGKYNLYLATNDPEHRGRVVDMRGGPSDAWPRDPETNRDFTKYADNWEPLVEAVGPNRV